MFEFEGDYFVTSKITQDTEHNPIHWKLMMRHIMFPASEIDKHGPMDVLCREGHGLNMVNGATFNECCVPDKAWLKFMVDALNEKVFDENSKNVTTVNDCGGYIVQDKI